MTKRKSRGRGTWGVLCRQQLRSIGGFATNQTPPELGFSFMGKRAGTRRWRTAFWSRTRSAAVWSLRVSSLVLAVALSLAQAGCTTGASRRPFSQETIRESDDCRGRGRPYAGRASHAENIGAAICRRHGTFNAAPVINALLDRPNHTPDLLALLVIECVQSGVCDRSVSENRFSRQLSGELLSLIADFDFQTARPILIRDGTPPALADDAIRWARYARDQILTEWQRLPGIQREVFVEAPAEARREWDRERTILARIERRGADVLRRLSQARVNERVEDEEIQRVHEFREDYVRACRLADIDWGRCLSGPVMRRINLELTRAHLLRKEWLWATREYSALASTHDRSTASHAVFLAVSQAAFKQRTDSYRHHRLRNGGASDDGLRQRYGTDDEGMRLRLETGWAGVRPPRRHLVALRDELETLARRNREAWSNGLPPRYVVEGVVRRITPSVQIESARTRWFAEFLPLIPRLEPISVAGRRTFQPNLEPEEIAVLQVGDHVRIAIDHSEDAAALLWVLRGESLRYVGWVSFEPPGGAGE